jgi:hypothetical protein
MWKGRLPSTYLDVFSHGRLFLDAALKWRDGAARREERGERREERGGGGMYWFPRSFV